MTYSKPPLRSPYAGVRLDTDAPSKRPSNTKPPIQQVPKDSSVEGLMAFIQEFAHRDHAQAASFIHNLKAYVDYHQPALSPHGLGQHGHTPLTLIAEMDKENRLFSHDTFRLAVLFLLEKGANPEAYTADGKHFLSYIWSRNRKNFGFIEEFLDKGYPLGNFDLDVSDGIPDLLANLLFPEFRRLGQTSFSQETASPHVWEKLNFYWDILEKKRDAGKKVSANPYMIFSRFTGGFSSEKDRVFLTEHGHQFQDWFKLCHDKGFDINHPDADGKTVIHHAIQIRSKPWLEVFLHFGADLFPNFYGTSIESYAFSNQFYDYAEWAQAKTEQLKLQALPAANTSHRAKKL